MQGIRGKTFVCGVMMIGVLFLLVSPGVAEEKRLEVIRTDSSYHKEVRVGESQTYTWTVANINEKNQTYRIEVSTGNYSGVDLRVSPSLIPALRPGEVAGITLTVTPGKDSDDVINVTVTILGKLNGTIIFRADLYAETKVIRPPAPPSEKLWLGLFSNPLPPPLNNDYGVFLLDVLSWLGIAAIIVILVDVVFKALTARTETKLDDIILETIRVPLLIWIFLFGIKQSLDDLDKVIPAWVLDDVHMVYNIVLVLILFYLGYKLFKNVIIYYAKEIAKRTQTALDDILVPVAEKLGIVVLALVAVGYLLNSLNVDLTMFIAGGVVISMVIAFAAQETLSNFFSGIFILLERPFKEGDTILLPGDEWCEVRKIGLRRTELFRIRDATLIAIPNNKIANEFVANFTSPEDKGKYSFKIGVSYESDPETVKRVLREIINDCPHIIKNKEALKPVVRFDSYGDSSINFFVLVWLTDRKYRFEVQDFINTEIFKRFKKEGIEIPFPQHVVHLKNIETLKEVK